MILGTALPESIEKTLGESILGYQGDNLNDLIKDAKSDLKGKNYFFEGIETVTFEIDGVTYYAKGLVYKHETYGQRIILHVKNKIGVYDLDKSIQ